MSMVDDKWKDAWGHVKRLFKLTEDLIIIILLSLSKT